MCNKNIEIGFQSAVCHLCQRALVPLLHNDRGLNTMASIYSKEKPSKALLITSVFSDFTFKYGFYLSDVLRE